MKFNMSHLVWAVVFAFSGSVLWAEDDPNEFNQTMGVSYVSSGESPAGNSCGWEVIAVRNGTSEEGSDGGQLTIELNTCLIFAYTLERFPQSGGSGGTTDLEPDDLIIVWDEDLSHGESEPQKNFTFSGTYSILEESDYEDYLRLSTTVDVTNWAVYCVETAGTFAKGSAGTNEHEVLKLCRNIMQFLKYDDISDANCVSPGDSITYSICFNNAFGQTLDGAFVLDWLPAGVDYDYIISLVPLVVDANYNPTDHSYMWDLTQIDPNTSGCVQLTVTANEKAVPGMYLHNVAELWGTVYDANGLNPESVVVARATEDTPVCCWDDGTVIYVDWSATGAESGMNWQDAYTDLQDALTRATETTCAEAFTIYVTQGTYRPEDTPEDGFVLPENVSVYGGFPTGGCEFSERNPKRYETILTGLIDEDEFPDARIVVTMGDETLLDGITIHSAFDSCLYGSGADFTVSRCTIKDSYGNGINAENGNIAVQWCMINSNGTTGIQHTGEGYSLTVDNSWIMRNGEYGVYCDGSTPTCRNNIISESDLSLQGRAGIRLYRPSYQPALHNNTIANNKAVGILFEDNGDITGDPNSLDYPDLQNSIVYYNGGNQVSGFNPDTVANFCCIQDCNEPGTTNFNDEPGFAYTVDPNGVPDPNNYHLAYDAFCKDKSNPFLTYTGQVDIDGEGLDRQYGEAVDIGADEVYDCDDDYLSEIDVHNALDWDADGIVNLNEFVKFSRAWLTYDPNHPLCDPNNLNYVSDPNLSGYIDQNDKLRFNPTCDLNSDLHVGLSDFVIFCNDWLWVACWKLDELNAAAATAQTESLMVESLSASRSLSARSLEAMVETSETQTDVSVETLVQIIGFLNEAEAEMPDNIDSIEAVRAILVEQLSAIVSNEEQ